MRRQDPLLTLLTESAHRYSRTQKVLAKFITGDYEKVAFSTIRQLAQFAHVSEATIVRFAKALGFRGYPAFQKEIRRIVRADLKGNERFRIAFAVPKTNGTSLPAFIHKEVENLSYLHENFDGRAFKKGVSAIRKAKEILVVGTRSTAPLAYHFWFGLTKLGFKASRVMAITTETYDTIGTLDRTSLIVVIGFPRYLRELIDLLTFSKERGIPSITITDSPLSSLRGDISLYTPAESISFMAFHCAPLVLINTIINELSLWDQQRASQALHRFEVLTEKRKYFDESNLKL